MNNINQINLGQKNGAKFTPSPLMDGLNLKATIDRQILTEAIEIHQSILVIERELKLAWKAEPQTRSIALKNRLLDKQLQIKRLRSECYRRNDAREVEGHCEVKRNYLILVLNLTQLLRKAEEVQRATLNLEI